MAVARVILENGWEDRASLDARVDPASEAEFRALLAEPRFAPDATARAIAVPGQSWVELAQIIRQNACR